MNVRYFAVLCSTSSNDQQGVEVLVRFRSMYRYENGAIVTHRSSVNHSRYSCEYEYCTRTALGDLPFY